VIDTTSGQVKGTYFYDGNARRVKKVTETETTVFVYNGMGNLVAEYSTATPPTNPTIHYTATDTLGSPRLITNAQGQVESRRDFMPFGEELYADGTYRKTTDKYSTTGQDAIRQRFTGYQRDTETSLDFAEARMYENRFGRFTAVDPLLASGKSANPQTFNRYVYVSNNPLIQTDPTGLIGDYYSRDGTYLTNDGKDDQKVYFADVAKIENGEIYAYTDSIKETTIEAVLKVQGNGTEDPNPIQQLAQGVTDGVNDGVTGIAKGVGNAPAVALNGVTSCIFNCGAQGFYFQGSNPFAAPLPFGYNNAREASYGSASSTGMLLGLGVAGGTIFGGSTATLAVPESTNATVHGASRMLTRGFTDADITFTRSGSQMLQKDGASVFLKETSSGRYNWLVEGNRGIVSGGKGWSWKSVSRMAANFQWYSPLK